MLPLGCVSFSWYAVFITATHKNWNYIDDRIALAKMVFFFSQLCDNWRVTMMMTTTRCNNNTSNKCAIGIFSQYFCRLKITALHIVLHMGDTNSHFYFSFLLFFFAALLFNPYGHIGIFFYIPNPMHGRARWRNVNISFSLSDWQLWRSCDIFVEME